MNTVEVKYKWARRSPEWVKNNPGKGSMYKVYFDGPPPENPDLKPSQITAPPEKPEKDRSGAGVYVIICEASKSAYVGQSLDMNTRLRAHKTIIQLHNSKASATYDAMHRDRKKYGIEAFEFRHHIKLPGATEKILLNREQKVMWEFIEKGYTLYNKAVNLGPESIYCPPALQHLMKRLISHCQENIDATIALESLLAKTENK